MVSDREPKPVILARGRHMVSPSRSRRALAFSRGRTPRCPREREPSRAGLAEPGQERPSLWLWQGQGARGRGPEKPLQSQVGGLRLGGAAAVLAEVHLRECEVSGRSLPASQEAGEDEEEAGDPRDHAGQSSTKLWLRRRGDLSQHLRRDTREARP